MQRWRVQCARIATVLDAPQDACHATRRGNAGVQCWRVEGASVAAVLDALRDAVSYARVGMWPCWDAMLGSVVG
jgi:TPP-dependent pyruvate/acetoin dehydrogenase alpha subunit